MCTVKGSLLCKGRRQRLASLFPKQPREGSGDSSLPICYVTGCFQHWIFIECCPDALMAIWNLHLHIIHSPCRNFLFLKMRG